MTGFLIDTNVVSEYNRPEGEPNMGVRRWLEKTPRDLQYVSVITLAEIQKGIGVLDRGRRRDQLERWLSTELEAWFAGRILPTDRRVASRWAALLVDCSAKGRPLPTIDSLLAATALAYDLTIVTRNAKDFEGISLTILNPWV